MTRRIFEKVKGPRVIWLSTLVVVVILLFLYWVHNTYDQQTMLLWLAILLATVSASVNAWSLHKTTQSLDLLRSSTRPFLSVTDVWYRPTSSVGNPEIALSICNTGSLPADEIEIEFELRWSPPDGEHAGRNFLEHGSQRLPTILPKETRESVFGLLPVVREIEATARVFLTMRIHYYFLRQYVHTFSSFSIPLGVNKLDCGFRFVILHGRHYWT